VLVTHGPGQPWTGAQSAATCSGLAPDAADCLASTGCYGIQSTNPFGPGNVVLRSADGGASWVDVGPDWIRSVLNDIACPDRSRPVRHRLRWPGRLLCRGRRSSLSAVRCDMRVIADPDAAL